MSGGIRFTVAAPPADLEEALFEILAGIPASWVPAPAGGLAIVVAAGDEDEAASALAAAGVAAVRSSEPERDWIAESAAFRRPVAVGGYLLDPHDGDAATDPGARRRLHVPATRAFGTGSHESTRLAMRLLLDEGPAGKSVLDVGCGVGTLALVAAAEGARRVVAFDIDPDAAFATRSTARANALPGLAAFAGPIEALGPAFPFDLVVANLIAEELGPLLPGIAKRLRRGGRLVTAGQLLDREAEWRDALRKSGLEALRSAVEGEWLGTIAERT